MRMKILRTNNSVLGIIVFTMIVGFGIMACDNPNDNAENPSSNPTEPEAMSVKSAMEYFRDEGITIGINLGNTLEAYNNWEDPSKWVAEETTWGNIKANQAYFNGLATQGFKIVRLPVSWFGHIGNAPNYTVSEAWLKRVAEVVGYAKNAGLKCFINMHHDGIAKYTPVEDGWHSLRTYLNSNATVQNQILEKYEKAWKQIAEYFQNYGDYLMFQGFNELHDGSWDDGLNNPQKYQYINELNKRFTNAVRSVGRNNSKRYLIYYGYNTSYKIAEASSPFVLPNDNDNGTSRQIVGFHFYYPFDFSHDMTNSKWPNSSENGSQTAIDTLFGNFKKKFIDNNIPVIIGENAPFRAFGKGSSFETEHHASRLAYISYMYSKARENEIVPFFWECGVRENQYSPGVCMNLFDRKTGQPSTSIEVAIIKAMMDAIKNTTPLSPGGGNEQETAAVITWGDGFADTDNGSSITVTSNAGEVIISGNANGWGAGVFGTPDDSTLARLKIMTSISFQVQGDGNSYKLMLPTLETDSSGDHFGKIFTTTNGQTITVTVNVSELAQSGSGAEFIQNNVKGLQFHPAGSGTFNLKIWEIKTH